MNLQVNNIGIVCKVQSLIEALGIIKSFFEIFIFIFLGETFWRI